MFCRLGRLRLPTDGCETSLFTNQNCAFCGDVCSLTNAQAGCVGTSGSGACTVTSGNTGYADCDTIAGNGCEVNTQTDAANCGSCGNECPSGPHSTAVCSAGACRLVCDPGYTDCDKNPTDGCGVDTNGSLGAHGSCGLWLIRRPSYRTSRSASVSLARRSGTYAAGTKRSRACRPSNVVAVPGSCFPDKSSARSSSTSGTGR